MPRSRLIISVCVFAASLLLLAVVGRRALDQATDPEPLQPTAGRVQLVIDEQDIGLVRHGMPLEIPFAVANTGSEKLILRQAPRECCGADGMRSFSVEPGQTGEIVARLTADDLLARGKKNIRFFTSDVDNPELWVTVRGTVIRKTALSEDDLPIERSVLVPNP